MQMIEILKMYIDRGQQEDNFMLMSSGEGLLTLKKNITFEILV